VYDGLNDQARAGLRLNYKWNKSDQNCARGWSHTKRIDPFVGRAQEVFEDGRAYGENELRWFGKYGCGK